MEKRVLGRTGLEVSVLGFGGAEIGFEKAPEENVGRLLGSALDTGLNVIDTAECYGSDETASESLIGQTVAHRRSEYFLFTKVGHASGLPHADWSPELLTASIERSLKRLKTDCVDLIQLHSCSRALLEQGEVIDVLRKAQAAGKTRFIGYSGENEAAEYAVACGAFDTLQTSVNLADQRGITQVLPKAAAAGMGVIAKRPIANASWLWPDEEACPPYSRPYWKRLQTLAFPELTIATALRFTLSVPGVTTAIVGTKNPKRWAQNAAILALGPLPDSEFDALRARWDAIAADDWLGQV